MKTNLVRCSSHGTVFSQSFSCPFCQSNSDIKLGEKIKKVFAPKPIPLYSDKIWFGKGKPIFNMRVFNNHKNS
ncbi:MAG: hypothetical protein HYS24_12935 [Ignavibacteriales bacterium]|nr:hypothetical protein [Ignavibacteriales bacterium]